MAQMQHQNPAIGTLPKVGGQLRSDEFVGKPVKPIAQHPRICERAGQGKDLPDPRRGAVKGGVETRDLRDAGPGPLQGVDSGKVMRLMRRNQWCQPLQLTPHVGGDPCGIRKTLTAMDHPVPGGDDLQSRTLLLQVADQPIQHLLVIGVGRQGERL